MFDADLAPSPTRDGRKRIVVGFAGGGGACVGIRHALGRDPDVAMNHWPVAVAAHRRHFPSTAHYCGDIWHIDCRTVEPGEDIGLGWFSPDCTDHSKAKGKAPRSERIRGLAWCMIPWAKLRRPDVILMENVEEWFDWGPVYRRPDDWRAAGVPGQPGEAIKALRGVTRKRFVRRLEQCGYQVEIRNLVAADFGAPTTRKRLVLVAVRADLVLAWPEPTHAPRHKCAELGRKPWRGACEVIDFSEPCPSIFLTREEARELRRATGVNCKRPLVANTLKRIGRGLDRFVIGAAEPFIVPITHAGDARVHGIGDPLRTATASSRGDFALISPTIVGCGGRRGQSPPLDVAEPYATVTGKNDACLVAGSLVRTNFQSAAARNGIHDLRDPMRTATGDGGFAAMSAFLAPRYGERPGQEPRCLEITPPMPTVVPGRNGGDLAAVHLQRQFGRSVGSEPAEPAGVVTPGGGGKTAMVAAHITKFRKDSPGQAVADPIHTITTAGSDHHPGGAAPFGLIAAALQSYYRTGEGSHPEDPVRAETAKHRHALTAAWLEQANTGMVGHGMPEPVSAIVGKGCTQRLIEARLELEGGPVGRRGLVLEFLWDQFGPPTAEEWADPLGSHRARLKFGLVVIDALVWMVVDIGLRMLKARELAGAMGLPVEHDLETDADGLPITTTDQVAMIGNMVCPDLVEAVCRALAAANPGKWFDVPEHQGEAA